MAPSAVSVVIVSHNSRRDLGRCLDEVEPAEREVIVVDNASTDDTIELVRSYPDVHVRALGENRGFGSANNAGVEVATGEYVLLLNPDAWPIGDAIDRLAEHMDRHPEVGVAGPKLVNPNGTVQRSIGGWPSPLWRGKPAFPGDPAPRRKHRLMKLVFRLRWIGRRPRNGERRAGRRVILTRQYLKGAVLLVRKDAFEAVGGFDPDFFLFSEELDLCARMRAAGWVVEFVPEAAFVHVAATSVQMDWPKAYREQLRSHLRLISKHRGAAWAEFARRFLVVALRGRAILRGRKGRPFADAARWLASGDVQTLLAAGSDRRSAR